MAVSAAAAVVGPQNNFDKNAITVNPDINGIDASALATRGLLYFDTGNDIGAVDRFTDALRYGSIADNRAKTVEQALAVARILGAYPDADARLADWIEANSASPHRVDMQLLRADILLERGRYSEALAAYLDIDSDALSPDLLDDYLYHRAYSYLVLARYDDARSAFAVPALLASSRYGNAARFYTGYISYINRNYPAALAEWENVNTAVMPGVAADYYRAQIAYYDGRYNDALRIARPLLSRSNVDPLFTAEANRIVGESLYQLGDNSAAIPYLKKYVVAVESPERSALYILGLAQYDEGLFTEAVRSLTPVTTSQSPMGQSAYLYIGQALLKTGDDAGAILAFNQALNMDFDRDVTEAAYYNYAVAKSRGAGVPFASSVGIFEDFLTRFPASRYADDVAAYIVTGYVTDGNYQAALNSINKVADPSPRILAAKQKVLYMLGARLLAAGKADDAVSLLRQCRQLAQYDPETALETDLVLGEALYRTGRYDEAATSLLQYLDNAPKTNPNRAVALYDLGYTRMAQHDWPNAATNFERLIAAPGNLQPSTLADAWQRLGDARYYQRDWNGAAEAYQSAFNLSPENGDYPLLRKAVMQGYARKYNDKLATIESMLDRFPKSPLVPEALLEKAEAYIQLRQPTKADDVYRTLIDNYGATAQGRRAYLFLAADMAGSGRIDEAIDIYQSLIAQAGTSDEARQADEAVKRLHADRGTLAEYAAFLKTVDGAPSMSADEAEALAWNAAEHAYVAGKGTDLLAGYVASYPRGTYTARALGYLLNDADNAENDADAYRWASLLIENYPDNAATELALAVKADIDYDRGRGMDALNSWKQLEQKASTTDNVNAARIGIMRVNRDLADAAAMRRAARAVLASSDITDAERNEAAFTVALAASLDGDVDTAVADWKNLAANTDDLYGAKAAVYAAEALNEADRYAEAAAIADNFVNSGTPHTYWLARAFIALSDAYAGQGRTFEAREYIKALKDNYPGNETDIFDMIEERLSSL